MQANLPHGTSAEFHTSVGSTMDLARDMRVAPNHYHWIVAETQTKGRARQGRGWVSPDNMFASTLVMNPNCPPMEAAQRSFVAACAVFKALADFVPQSALSQKWPNDVLLNGGKVAGILLESSGQSGAVDHLGVGIGVNLGFAPPNVPDAAFQPTGVADVLGHALDRDAFFNALATAFHHFDLLLIRDGFSTIRQHWLTHAAKLGQQITARTGRETITGVFDGIDASGSLIILTPEAKRVIPAADVFF